MALLPWLKVQHLLSQVQVLSKTVIRKLKVAFVHQKMTYPCLAFTQTWVKVMVAAVRQTQTLRCAKTLENHLRAFSAPYLTPSLERNSLRRHKRHCTLLTRPACEKSTALHARPIRNLYRSTIQVLTRCKSRCLVELYKNDQKQTTRHVTLFSRLTATYGRTAPTWLSGLMKPNQPTTLCSRVKTGKLQLWSNQSTTQSLTWSTTEQVHKTLLCL